MSKVNFSTELFCVLLATFHFSAQFPDIVLNTTTFYGSYIILFVADIFKDHFFFIFFHCSDCSEPYNFLYVYSNFSLWNLVLKFSNVLWSVRGQLSLLLTFLSRYWDRYNSFRFMFSSFSDTLIVIWPFFNPFLCIHSIVLSNEMVGWGAQRLNLFEGHKQKPPVSWRERQKSAITHFWTMSSWTHFMNGMMFSMY